MNVWAGSKRKLWLLVTFFGSLGLLYFEKHLKESVNHSVQRYYVMTHDKNSYEVVWKAWDGKWRRKR